MHVHPIFLILGILVLFCVVDWIYPKWRARNFYRELAAKFGEHDVVQISWMLDDDRQGRKSSSCWQGFVFCRNVSWATPRILRECGSRQPHILRYQDLQPALVKLLLGERRGVDLRKHSEGGGNLICSARLLTLNNWEDPDMVAEGKMTPKAPYKAVALMLSSNIADGKLQELGLQQRR